jgi:hypothetical protein
MAGFRREPSSPLTVTSSVAPLLCLLGVVVLLSSVTLIIKYVFQHSDVQPLGLAQIRVTIGFIFLAAVTLVWDCRGLLSLGASDLVRLTLVGFLGVFSYAIAACGLMYTSVTHYALIYSNIQCAVGERPSGSCQSDGHHIVDDWVPHCPVRWSPI